MLKLFPYLFPSMRVRKCVYFGQLSSIPSMVLEHGRHPVNKCWMKKKNRMNDDGN